MKKHMILMGCAMGLLLVPAVQAEEKHTPLGKQMEAVNDAFKGFRSETDPVKGAKEARDAQTGVLKAAMEVPELIGDMKDGPEKDKALNAYKTSVGKLYISLCEVEKAFLNNDLESVASIVDTIKKMKKEGHKEFMKEDE